MTLVSKILKHCVTGLDGETYDPARIYGLTAVLVFFVLALFAVMGRGQAWDPAAYGIGFGALLAGFGLGINLKAKTEPEQNK